MPLILCPDCQAKVSDSAAVCPQCARPIASTSITAKERQRPEAIWFAIVGFFLGSMLVWGGCGHFNAPDSSGIVVCALGGVLFAILGAILGAVVDHARKQA